MKIIFALLLFCTIASARSQRAEYYWYVVVVCDGGQWRAETFSTDVRDFSPLRARRDVEKKTGKSCMVLSWQELSKAAFDEIKAEIVR